MNPEPTVCPNCHHEREPDTPTPPELCPRCGKEYASWDVNAWRPERGYASQSGFNSNVSADERIQRYLSIALGLVVILGLVSCSQKGENISASDIEKALLQKPKQTNYTKEDAPPDFTFEYRDAKYEVHPMAKYEMWGLVMTHNNIGGFGDSYHNENSVDTKDLCVIWGGNVLSDSFNDVEFKSGSWTCYISYGQGVSINFDELSNSHLVTNQEGIRDLIADVRIGDQVHIKGMLVNYRDVRYNFWRKSSMIRDDTGNGACEVIFVNEMKILSRGTPIWYFLYSASGWLIVLLIAAKLGLFAAQLKRQP